MDTAGLAVVTGGASGFGYETSTRLLKAGMAVAILDISVKELANAQKSLGEIAAANNTKVHGIQCNVTKKSDCINAANEIAKAFFLINRYHFCSITLALMEMQLVVFYKVTLKHGKVSLLSMYMVL